MYGEHEIREVKSEGMLLRCNEEVGNGSIEGSFLNKVRLSSFSSNKLFVESFALEEPKQIPASCPAHCFIYLGPSKETPRNAGRGALGTLAEPEERVEPDLSILGALLLHDIRCRAE